MKGGRGGAGREKGGQDWNALPPQEGFLEPSPAFKSPRGTPPMLPSRHPQGKRTPMEDALSVGGLGGLGWAYVVEIGGPSLFSIPVPSPPHLSSALGLHL